MYYTFYPDSKQGCPCLVQSTLCTHNSQNYQKKNFTFKATFQMNSDCCYTKATMLQPNRLQQELYTLLALLLKMCVNKHFKAHIHNLFLQLS